MAIPKQLKLQHLLWRAGFGPNIRTWPQWENLDEQVWWSQLQKDSAKKPEYFDVADGAVSGLLMGVGELGKMESDRKRLSKEEREELRRQSRKDLNSLNLVWLEEMVHSPAQLREKMALFWHGHFASRNINILYQQQLLHIFRTHALGNFADLLRAVSKSAAMLAFLNNQQNKKQQPNENFAREVMELFTLGRGHYTETDIKEAARAFTGWGFKLNGEFVFRRVFHDTGKKTVLGKTGNFDGDDVLDILLAQRQTAHFIARKLYRFLVNEETIPSDDRVHRLGDRFFDSGYDIMALLDGIFTSNWFFEEINIGTKIKSPVELWVGMRRTVPFSLTEPTGQLILQRALGQVLLYPPNVAGWPGGRSWIDSSALMLRLRLPHIIAAQSELDISPKDDDDQMMGRGGGRLRRRLEAQINWTPLLDAFSNRPQTNLIPELARFFWQQPQANPPLDVLKNHTNAGSKDQLIQSAALQLMATPEYQLC